MRNKRILLSLLIYLSFTEMTLAKEKIIDILKFKGLELKIKPENTSPICFYYENYFQGKKFCLNSSEVIDFKIKNNIGVRADEIHSIKIPETHQIIVYQGEHSFTLTDSILQEAWQKITGKNDVTGIVATTKKRLSCDTNCIIAQKMIIPLSAIFAPYSADIQYQERSILLSFEKSHNTFDLSFNNFMEVTVDNGLVSILPAKSQQIDFPLNQDTTHISFLFSWHNNTLSLSFLETMEGKLLHLSPTISMSPDDLIHQEDIYLAIFNSDDRQPLTMPKVLMAVHNEPGRTKRGTTGILGCFLSGPLALYNVITQGRCNQVESAWHHIKAFFSGDDPSNSVIAGKAVPLKPKLLPTPTLPEVTSPTLRLTQLNTDLHGQSLTLPAVSYYCQTPLEHVVGARFPRQIKHSCYTWMSSVLADFTLLFGRSLHTWSTEYLIQTLNGILDRRAIDGDNDAIDAFIRDPRTGNRLIQTINDVAEEYGRSALIDSLTQAFIYAEHVYMQYAVANNLPGPSSANSDDSCHSLTDFDSEDYSSSDSDIASPLQTQQYPLGTYQMPISSYVHQDVLPRVLHNGEWQVSHERFDIEIIQGTHEQTRHSIYDLLETIATWENTYQEQQVHCNHHGIFPTEMETNRYAGQVTSRLITSHAQHPRSDQIIIVVRFNHQIVSVSVADSYFVDGNPEMKRGTIRATLTNPAYVLTPQIEGAIRGAGSAALHTMIQHLIDNDISVIEAEVISTPSAMIKKRIGFVFIPYPYNSYPLPATAIPTPEPKF
ncbi:hypothetical protein [Yersinia aleksiciae]|uniref:hypothetical protein n=1 Tax=Yersinia aleksiciae TaxID=263819 RepID=UPI0011A06657|nr:hypothetical protein [Yersinia aleksiciae]